MTAFKRVVLLFIAFFIFTLVFINKYPSNSFGISQKPFIIIGDDIDYPPYSFIDKDGNAAGFNIDLAKAVAEVMGLEIEFRLGTWSEITKMLRSGEIDVVSGMFFSPERTKDYAFTINHSVASGDIFSRQDTSIKSIEELIGSKVVVQANDIVSEFIRNTGYSIDLVEVDTVSDALRLVASGEYNYAAVLRIPGHYLINAYGLTNLKSNGIYLGPKNYSMAVKADNTALLDIINEGLVIIRNTGKYDEIYNKWLGVYEERDFSDRLKKYFLIFVALGLISIVLFLSNLLLKRAVNKKTRALSFANEQLQIKQDELLNANEELFAANEELSASLEQLSAIEEELRNHYELLKESEDTFRTLFESSSDAVFLMEDGKFIDCNSATLRLLGYSSKEEIIGKSPIDISPEIQLDGQSSKGKAAYYIDIALREGNTRFEWWHKRKEGLLIPLDIMLTKILLKDKNVIYAICRDITMQKQAQNQLEYLSYHDQLTGLHNRRYFDEKLRQLDFDENFPLTIVMADVNGLKLVNDAFGHAIGDLLLIKVSEALAKSFPSNSIISRLGGDEFVVVLKKTDYFEAEELVKGAKRIIQQQNIESINLSVSFGLDTKYNEAQDIRDILKNAEDNMYKIKLYEGPIFRSKNVNLIMNTLHEKSKREEAHSHRVANLCHDFGLALGLSEEKAHELRIIGLLHDIGKIAVEESILNKSGGLSNEEWKQIRKHPEIGYRILSSVKEMLDIAEYILAHHESWDGTGYPKGLKEKEIPLQARITSIVDAYDAMTSERSYKPPRSKEDAITELLKCAGTQFDPVLVNIFINRVLSK